ncbi:MAG: acetyltransferase [Lachnospiraceae bacterium]
MTLGIYCAGGLGREVLELARQVGGFETIVFVDDGQIMQEVNDVPVLSFLSFCAMYPPESAQFILANGEPNLLQLLFQQISSAGYKLQTLVHPIIRIPHSCYLGQGVVVQANVFISSNATLADGVYLNVNCAIGHNVKIGRFSNISMGCMIAGGVQIGDYTYIGAGTLVREDCIIGSHCIIGMGSMVLSNIPDHCLAYGNPARVIRTIKDNTLVF